MIRGAISALCGLGRFMRGLVILVLALGLVGAGAGLVLAWRLSQGPLDIEWAARRAEARVNVPDAPTRLSIGHAAVAWAGFSEGDKRGLEIRLADVRLHDRRDRPVAVVRELEAILSVPRLLIGQVVPVSVSAAGTEVALVRDANGDVRLDTGAAAPLAPEPAAPEGDAGPSLAESLAELARPMRHDDAPAPQGLQHLEQLRHVRLRQSALRLHDARAGAWRLDIPELDLVRQPGGGVRGKASAVLGFGAAEVPLAMEASLAPGGGTQVQVATAPVPAAAVQAAMERGGMDAARGPGVMDAALTASGSLLLSPALLPTGAALRLEAGGGRIVIAGAPIGFDNLVMEARATWDQPRWGAPSAVAVPRAKAVLRAPGGAWPSTVTMAMEARAAAGTGRILGTAEAAVDHVAFADLGALWPERLGGQVRPWLTQNITAGTARNGAVKLAFDAGRELRDVRLVTVDGSLAGDDVSIWWLRPVAPIEHAQALLTIKSPENLVITVASGRQGGMALANGVVRITGLDVKDQFLALTADAAGTVPELLGLLRHPRLRLLDRKPIPMRNPGGAFTAKLGVTLPLNHDLDFDDVKISAQGRATDLRLGGLVAGRDLERGDVTLEATSEALKVAGTATIAGIPAELTMDMDFRGGPPAQVVQRAQAVGRAGARQLAGAGLDPGGLIAAGTGRFTAKYVQRRDGSGDIAVTGDLREAGLALAGWKKAPGQPAEVSARVLVRGDRMTGIDQLHAQGPGMAVEGRAEMVGNRPLNLVLDRIVLGPTQARGTVRFPETPGQPIRANLVGTVLDLSDEFGKKPAGAPAPASTGPPWVADVRFDRVLLSGQRGLDGLVAHAEHDGRQVRTLQATSAGAERLEAAIRAEGQTRRVAIRAADGGALLRAFDVVDSVDGGRLVLNGVYDDRQAGSPMAGTAELSGFHVRNAPGLGKLLQAVTIYGVVEALSGPGLAFSQLTMPFRYGGGVLDITDGQAFSASLGLTGKGRIDTARGTIDMKGTVVPAYVLNSLLGRIPLLGRLFSAERGGGLVAVNYALRGPVADPSVSVNPLSALTPGFLRGLFSILD